VSESAEHFEDLIAKRLVAKADSDVHPRQAGESEAKTQLQKQGPLAFPSRDVKVDKNLVSLGFFTPSSKRIKTEKAKVIRFTKTIDGTKVEATATIVPAAIYGLPITADQDKYLALQKIVTDLYREKGRVQNPIGFTSAELLRLLHDYRDSGKNYKAVREWLNLMTSTTIISDGAVYYAGKKRFATDRFHVFDRAVTFGEEIEPGQIADKNYVWLSEWQLENINNNHVLPVDLEAYTRLTKHIAKILVPLLQIWLHATREQGSFEKRYDHLCEILSIRQYRHLSDIKRFFGSSLDELKAHGYLADWKIERTSDRKGFKVVFYHGDKFYSDRRRRLAQKQPTEAIQRRAAQVDSGPEVWKGIDAVIFEEMTKRGIPESEVRKILATVDEDQEVVDQLEWGDYAIQQGTINNPVGFYIHLIKSNYTVPDSFETSGRRRLRQEAAEAHDRAAQEQARLKLAYERYKATEIDKYIGSLPEGRFQELLQAKREELSRRLRVYRPSGLLEKLVIASVRSDQAGWVTFDNFESFCEKEETGQYPVAEQGRGEGPATPELPPDRSFAV